MKKIIAVLTAIIFLILPLSACSSGETVPKGMQLASAAGEPFKLYVPEGMNVNIDSGISGAFVHNPDKIVISARYYTPADPEMTVAEYISYCEEGYAGSLTEFLLVSRDPAVLAEKDAIKLVYTAKIDSVDYTCTQYTVLHKGDMVSLHFYIPTDSVAAYADITNSVMSNFVLCDKAEPNNDELVDKNTPDGMKIASHDKIEYRFYVPKSWICDSESGISEAYYPESEKTNVTVTAYSPDGDLTAAEYIALCEDEYKTAILGYELVEKLDGFKVANKDAISLTFKANYDGIEYKIRQTTFVYNGMIYSITYTATDAAFDLHTEDLEQMISEFSFR